MWIVVHFLFLAAFGLILTILSSCVGALHRVTDAASRKLEQQKSRLDRARQATGSAVREMLMRWAAFIGMVIGIIVRVVNWFVVGVLTITDKAFSAACKLVTESSLYKVMNDTRALSRCMSELLAARSENLALNSTAHRERHTNQQLRRTITAREERIRHLEECMERIKTELECPLSLDRYQDPVWLTPCGHVFSQGHLTFHYDNQRAIRGPNAVNTCPMCMRQVGRTFPANFPILNILRIIDGDTEELRRPQWVQ
jgi:hypothetical protein